MKKKPNKKNVFATKNEKRRYNKYRSKGEYKTVKVFTQTAFWSKNHRTLILPGTSFIVFRISLVFFAHSFQTDFVFKSVLPHFQKGCLIHLDTLLFSICSKNNSPGEDCLVISGAINVFQCNDDVCFPSKILKLDVYDNFQRWP